MWWTSGTAHPNQRATPSPGCRLAGAGAAISRPARPRLAGAVLGHQRRPPPLDPLDRLGADDREGDDEDDDGRLAPCDGTLGAVTALPEPLLVDGFVWVVLPLLPLLVVLLPLPLDVPLEVPELPVPEE
jgi:hypothetical protein